MTTQSVFYYPVTVHQDSASSPDVAQVVHTLPLEPDNEVTILLNDVGDLKQGLYVFLGTHWQFAMPYPDVCYSVIRGDTINVYSNHTDDVTAPTGSTVFKNGVQQGGLNVVHGNAVYAVRTPPAGGGGGSGTVTSVNGQMPDGSGNVLLTAANIGGISTVGKTGQYSDLIGAPAPYVLPIATTTVLGGVIVPSASNLVVDVQGNVDIKAALITTINGKFGAATSAGTGTSLVNNQGGGVLNLKSIKAGTNVTLTDDGLGTVTIASADMPLTPATSTGLGGVIVPNASNISVDVNGNIDIKTAVMNTINSALQSVEGSGVATSLYRQQVGSAAQLKDIAAGTNVTITDDGNGTLTIAATAGSSPIASASTLGVIRVGSGLSIDGSGILSATAGSTTLTGDVIGSGTGSIATTLSNTGVTAGTYTKVTVDAKGRVTVGASLASGDVTTALGYIPYNGGTNPSGFISGNQNITVSGDASGSGTTAIALTLANSGVSAGTYTKVTVDTKGRVTVGASLNSSDVTTALGYTPYNGGTNPNGFLTANQVITVSGDASGTGSTSIALTLANSGVSAGTYTQVTVDAKGRVTTGANPTTLAGYGITNALANTGGSVSGNITLTSGATVTGVPTPVNPGDAASMSWVQSQIASLSNGISWKANAQVATTADITLSGLQTIDGYAVQSGDRVLVKNQTNPVENGVYVAAAGAWSRATDVDTGVEIQGMAILVLNGTTQQLTQWVNTNSTQPVVDTDPISYTELQGASTPYTAGTGLTLTSNQFSITNTGVTTGTYTKVTVNAQGQVTTGASLNSSDVTTALGFTPYNATNPSGYISANQNITVSGDATGSGTTAIALTLAASGVTAGTYKSVTVDAKGRVTNGTNPTTLAGFGITDALALAGGTMTGNIVMTGGATVTGVPNPSGNTDVSNKSYTDAGDTATLNAVSWKQVVQVASTADLTLSGTQTIDGYAAQVGDRVLAKDQSTSAQNGIYVVASGAWTRATDAATGAQLLNQIVMVLNGTANAHTQWLNTNTGTITVGTTGVTYAQTSGASGSTTLTGDVTGSGTGSITTTLAASGVTAGTYTKVTVDAKGRVTVGANIASSDVTTALGFTPYDAANPSGYISANQTITLSGDATGSGSTAITVALANSGVSAGTYTKVTVDAKGRVTVGANLASGDVTTALGYTPANKAGDTFSGAVNLAPLANVTAAATTPIGAATTNTVNVLGTTTITAFDTIAGGAYRTLIFAASLTLTHNATSLILPTGANIQTAAGDVAEFVSLGSGNWKCISYNSASGQALVGAPDATKLPLAGGTMSGAINNAPTVTLASASTVNIGAAAANDISITGTTTITAFDSIASGAVRTLVFAGALTLTHNATSLILPGAANITTAAGDVAQFTSKGSGNWVCDYYTKANGQAVVGSTPYTAGTGLTLSSNQFSITNTGVSTGTFSKVTVNAQGQVTVGANIGSSDVTTALGYTPANKAGDTFSGAVNGAAAVTLASAATVNIGAAAANEITITGTTTITAFDTIASGAVRTLTFNGALTLTHNATSLILPGGASITTAAGDVAQFVSLGGGNWRCEFYTKANGQAVVSSSAVTSVFGQTGAVPNLSGDVTTSGSSATTLAASGVTAGTYTKVTVDAKGRVTVGANLASGDVTTALGYTPVNKAGDSMSGNLNWAATINVGAAATTNIGAANSNVINITGSTTITAFDTAPDGAVKTLNFIGAPLLTYNASTLLLPGAANIQTATNDQATFVSKGSGVWVCIAYSRANGQAFVGTPDATKLPLAGGTMSGALNNAPIATLASAATVNIGAAAANDISISGTTTITAFDTIASGARRKLTFQGALTLTHNGTSLILPGAANITTAAGDVAQFTSLGSGNWRCDFYTKANGQAVSGNSSGATLTNPTITNFTESGSSPAAGSAGTVDLTQGTDWEFTTNANFTATLPTPAAGKSFTLTINYGGAHTLTFAGGTVRWANGTVPTATSTNGKADVYIFKSNRAGTAWLGNDGGRNY